MVHEFDVVTVIAADVGEVVSKFLALGEQLFESAEAAGHRVSARVDNLRIRQYQLDQADMPEVVRHFVDKERCVLAVDASVFDKLLTECL